MPLVLSSKCYLFFPVPFLGCEHQSLLSSHALIGHQGAGNTEWPEQSQPWHFSGRALSLLGISCSSPPLPHLVASLAGQWSPLEHSKSCCFQKKFVSSKEKKKNESLQLSGNTKPLFLRIISWQVLVFLFCFLWQKSSFETPGVRSRLCWGFQHGRGKIWFDSLLQMRQRTDLSAVFVMTFPWTIQQQSKQMEFCLTDSWLCTPKTSVRTWLSAVAH